MIAQPLLTKWAKILLDYSTQVRDGEVVFIRGLSPSAEPLVSTLVEAVYERGAIPFVYMHLHQEALQALRASKNLAQLAMPNPMLMKMYTEADVIIAIRATEYDLPDDKFSADQLSAISKASSAPIQLQHQRLARGEVRRCVTQFPTPYYAHKAHMDIQEYLQHFINVCHLNSVNSDDPVHFWANKYQEQQTLCDYFTDKHDIHIQGPSIDLKFSISGRIFINSAGKGNFPDGEIFTSPVEDSVKGWVQFNVPAVYQNMQFDNLRLEFNNGAVFHASTSDYQALLNDILSRDKGAKRLGEFGIGTNTMISIPTGDILFDEKIAGTIHLALGRGFPQAGGRNESTIHWDLVHDLRDGSTITVDGVKIYTNGKFL